MSALLCATEGSSSQNQQQLIPQLLEATSLSEARDEKMGLKKPHHSQQNQAHNTPASKLLHTDVLLYQLFII